jgi:hypothetical protein
MLEYKKGSVPVWRQMRDSDIKVGARVRRSHTSRYRNEPPVGTEGTVVGREGGGFKAEFDAPYYNPNTFSRVYPCATEYCEILSDGTGLIPIGGDTDA